MLFLFATFSSFRKMPEINELTWSHKELIGLLVRAANIHEGTWMIEFKFAFAPMNSGPSDDQIVPGLLIGLTTVGIRRALPGAPAALVVDAAEVNPPG
jgi:hypothetical protein